MQNSVVMFTFFDFDHKYPFLNVLNFVILVLKIKIVSLILKFGTYTNMNMQNPMVMFIFSILEREYPFWANLVQKIKVVSLN